MIRTATSVPYLPAREPRELVFMSVECPLCGTPTAFDVTDGIPIDEMRAALHSDACLQAFTEIVR